MKKTLKFLMLLIIAVWGALATSLNAQTIISIGDGNEACNTLPVYALYNYSYTQQIYTSDEVGVIGNIVSVAFHYTGPAADNEPIAFSRDVVIYMKSVSRSDFDHNLDYEPVTPLDVVYTGTLSATDTGWITITLDNPFMYDGQDNLMIAVDDNTGTWKGRIFTGSTIPTFSICGSGDGSNPNPYDMSNYDGINAIVHTRSDIRLGINVMTISCQRPSGLTATNTTTTHAELTWTAGGDETTWEVEVNGDRDFAYDTVFSIDTISAGAQYLVRVRAICGDGDTSVWTSYTFTAPLCDEHCTYSLDLEDEYGDGWNGASLDLMMGGTLAYNVTLGSGSSQIIPVELCNNMDVSLVFHSGSYDSEVSFELTDPFGNSVYSSGSAPNAGTLHTFTVSCTPPSCFRPSELTVIDSTITTTSAEIFWTENNEDFLGPWEVNVNGEIVTVSSNPATLTDLNPGTDYTISVRALCDAENTSDWSISTTFVTGCTFVSTYPYVQDFSSANFPPVCWSQERTEAGNGPDSYGVVDYPDGAWARNSSPIDGNNTPKAMLRDSRAGSKHNLVTGAFDFSYDGGYVLRLDVYRGYADPAEGVRILVSSNPEIDATTDTIAFIPANYGTASSIAAVESQSGWHTYEVSILGRTGLNYIIFEGLCMHSYNTLYMDNVLVKETPTCARPTNLTVSNILTDGATIAWTDGNEDFTGPWEVEFNGETIEVNSNPCTLTDLTSGTDYSVRVRALCSDEDFSEWSMNVLHFSTECLATAVPYFQDFDLIPAGSYNEDPSLPACWSSLNNVVGNTPLLYVNNNAANYCTSQPNCLYFVSGQAIAEYAIMPFFTEPDVQLSFYYRNESISDYNGTLIVGYMTDPLDEETFVALETMPQVTELTYKEIIFLGIEEDYHIAFKYMGGASSGYYLSLDDIAVTEIPDCITPSQVAVENLYATSFDVVWTDLNEDFTGPWEVAINSDTVETYDNPYHVDEISANSTYTISVRSMCGGDVNSNWSVPFSIITTLCSPAPSGVDNNGITNVTFGQSQIVNNSTHPASMPYYGDYTAQVGDAGISTEVTVNITYNTGYTYGTVIWVNWNNDLQFTDDEIVYVGMSTNAMPTTLAATFQVPATVAEGSYRMRIGGADSGLDNAPYNPCYEGSYAVFEDYTLLVTAAPSCIAPNELEVSSVTTSEATIAWNARGDESSWEIECNDVSTVVTTNPYMLTGLTPGTAYSVRVRAICGADDASMWTSAVSFVTECESVVDFPYVQDFDADIFPPVCWFQERTNFGTGAYGTDYPEGAWARYDGTMGGVESPTAQLRDARAGSQHNLVTGSFDFSYSEGYILSLDVFRNADMSNYATEGIRVLVSSHPYIDETTDTLAFISRNYLIASDVNSSIVGAEAGPNWYTYELPINRTGVCYIIFEGNNQYGSSTFMDNVIVKENRPCQAPTSVTASNIGQTSATIAWTDNNGNFTGNWEVEVNGTTEVATENPYILTGLTADADYTVRVRALCSDVDASEWSSATSFHTAAAAECPTPTNLAATVDCATGNCAAAISWTQEGTVSEWGLNYKKSNDQTWTNITVTTNPYTITDLEGGASYDVRIEAHCADGEVSEVSDVLTFTATGVNDYLILSTTLFPNPTNSVITIQNNSVMMQEVAVYDVYGKLLRTVAVNGNSVNVDVASLADGMYFVRILTDKGMVTKSFIKK